jgi:hypothetical protein
VIISLPCGVAVSSLKLVVPRAWCLIWFFLDFSALCRLRAGSFPLQRIHFLHLLIKSA